MLFTARRFIVWHEGRLANRSISCFGELKLIA